MIFNAYSDTTEGIMELFVKSAGHIFAKNGRTISRPGGREDWLLFYVAKESETFYLDKEIIAEEGSFIFYRPHEKQEHIYQGDKTAEFYYVHFIAPPDFDLFGFESSRVYSAKPSPNVRDLFEEILDELQTKQPRYEKICAAKLFTIMGLLGRLAADLNNPHIMYMDKISFIVQLMNREFDKNYSLVEYAKMCQMSKFHFLRVFKDITGSSPIEYRNKIRIEHAKELLEDISIPIYEVGTRVGYTSSSYFCDAFKEKVGFSPMQYRQKIRSK